MGMRRGEVTHSKEGSRSKEQALLEKGDDEDYRNWYSEARSNLQCVQQLRESEGRQGMKVTLVVCDKIQTTIPGQ